MADRKREKQWFTSSTNFNTLTDGSQEVVQLYNATIHGPRFMKGATVLRSILDMRIQAAAVAQTVICNWGMLIVNEDARVAGAVPDPGDTSDRPDYIVRGKLTTVQASLSDSSQWDRRYLDVRSGRTLNSEEDGLVIIVENNSGGGFTLNYYIYARILLLLP